jgi:hypothetical protein
MKLDRKGLSESYRPPRPNANEFRTALAGQGFNVIGGQLLPERDDKPFPFRRGCAFLGARISAFLVSESSPLLRDVR